MAGEAIGVAVRCTMMVAEGTGVLVENAVGGGGVADGRAGVSVGKVVGRTGVAVRYRKMN